MVKRQTKRLFFFIFLNKTSIGVNLYCGFPVTSVPWSLQNKKMAELFFRTTIKI